MSTPKDTKRPSELRGEVSGISEAALKGVVLRIRNVAVMLLSSLCCGVLAWRLWIQGDSMRELAGGTPLLGVPLAPIFYAMAILSALCAVLTLIPASGNHGAAAEVQQ